MPRPENCRYLKTHEWVCAEGAEALVGVSDHAQKEITDVVFVELPKVGRKVAKGEAVAVVESVKAAFDIYSPVSGEIAAVNEEAVKNPALVNQSPQDQGWLFRVRMSDPGDLEGLMDLPAYQEFLKEAAHH